MQKKPKPKRMWHPNPDLLPTEEKGWIVLDTYNWMGAAFELWVKPNGLFPKVRYVAPKGAIGKASYYFDFHAQKGRFVASDHTLLMKTIDQEWYDMVEGDVKFAVEMGNIPGTEVASNGQ